MRRRPYSTSPGRGWATCATLAIVELVVSSAAVFVLIMDPLGNVPLFLAALRHTAPERRRRIVVRELLIALAVMLIFLFGGNAFMELFHVETPALAVAGGIILLLIALRMIFPTPERNLREASPDDEPFIVPLSIPGMAGPSSMATVCGASLALMDAGVPLTRPVAGIAMGLILEGKDFAVLSDILGDEDHLGDMDFKVAGTSEGVTALQMDIKIAGITEEIMKVALAQAREGRLHILGEMAKALTGATLYHEYQKLIADFSPVMRKLDESLEKQISQHSREGQNDLKRFIDTFFVGMENSRDDADRINSQLKNFNSKLGEKFQEITNERLQAIADDLTKEFQASVKSTYQHSLLTRIPDFKLDTITEQVEAGTRSGTKKRNAGIGSLLGAGIGFLVAGPAGAAVGSMVGGGLGSATGDSASIRYRDVQITVGDNLQDIRRKLLDTHCEALDVLLQKNSTNLWQEFEGSIKTLLKKLSAEMAQFDSELQKILNKTKLAL